MKTGSQGPRSGDVLTELAAVIESRKGQPAADSYVASLYAKGLNGILKKVGEEATEVVVAAKDGQREALVKETADLWFHTLVMLAKFDLHPDDVLNELGRRQGVSGHTEKASRGTR